MRFVIWIIALLGVGFAGYIFIQSQKLVILEKKERQDFEQPALIKGMTLYEYNQNQLSWVFQIKAAELYEKKKLTYISDISGRIFSDSNESQPIKIKALNGVIDNNSRQMTLKNKVQLSLADGSIIETEYLVVDLRNEKIFNHHRVVIKSKRGIINGTTIEYDIKTANLKLKQINMGIAF